MISEANFYKYFNKPITIIAAVFILSFTMATLTAQHASADAPHNPLTVRDDYCYSTLNALQGIPGFQFGLVNAVVNVPVYDWDQNTPSIAFDALHDYANDTRLNIARQSVAPPVGYANKFNFSVTPVPNIRWVGEYLARQLPYDIGVLASIVTGSNPVPEPDPHTANPFIYQQGAIILPSGLPRIQVINKNQPPMNTNPNNAVGNIGGPGQIIKDNPDVVDGAQEYVDPNTGQISDEYQTGTQAGIDDLVRGPLGFASNSYWVDGNNPADNCYEYITSTNKVPAYAFSVVGAGVPITIPGTFYSLFTILAGKGPSVDGMTIYPASLNGKDMLDCYGRGVTPTMVLTSHRMGDPPRDIEEAIWFAVSWAADLAVVAPQFSWAGIFAPPLIAAAMLLPQNWFMRRLPTPHSRYINYFNGFSFAFTLSNKDIELPPHLKNRAIDFPNSKMFYVNLWALLHPNPNGHVDSQNSHSFNPNIYLKLKKSYELKSDISLSGDYRRTPDGTEVRVDVDANKTGFDKGTSRSDPYERDATDKGGPTYEDRDGRRNVFSHARVYRIELKPGVSSNAIDVDKLKNPGNPDDKYYGHLNGQDPCAIFTDKLTNGDDAHATIPRHRSTTANKDVPEFTQPDAVKCGLAPGTGNPINIIMDENTNTRRLLGNYIEKIPAETPPGTKICYAIWFDNYGNDVKYAGQRWWDPADIRVYNQNPNYNADPDKSYLSRAKCIISGYKPSFQVRGGDIMVGKNIFTDTNTKDFLATPDPNDKRTYGSWSEYGAFAGGVIQHLGSGAVYRLGMPQSLVEHGYLTLSNNRDDANDPDYGKYNGAASEDKINDGFDKVANQFTSRSDAATPLNSSNIDLKALPSGTYVLQAGPVNITAGNAGDPASNELPVNRSIILLAQEDTVVNVNSSVRIPTQYSSIGEISQLVIAPASSSEGYKINIASNVTRLDSWLINPNGQIDTCYVVDDGTTPRDLANTPRSKSSCDSTLFVNGPVSAEILYLRRSGGKDQSSDPTKIEQSVPGEVFNLRPDAYLWAASHVDNASKKYVTTNVMDLPPRY
jgi:hypothetical protein